MSFNYEYPWVQKKRKQKCKMQTASCLNLDIFQHSQDFDIISEVMWW